MGFSVDVIGFVFRINDFLAAIEPVIAGKHIAECDSEQKIRHRIIAEQFEADKQSSDGAVRDTTEYSGHADSSA